MEDQVYAPTNLEELADVVRCLPKEYDDERIDVHKDGNDYVVTFYRKNLSNPFFYTRYCVYDCITTIDSWGGQKRACLKALGCSDWMEECQRNLLHKRGELTMDKAMKPYYKYQEIHIDGFPDGMVVRVTKTLPYDD